MLRLWYGRDLRNTPRWATVMRKLNLPVTLPITSGGNFARTAGFAVPLTGAGTKTTGVVGATNPALSIWPRAAAGSWKTFPTRSWTRFWRG
jgi:hypothetical protein